MAEIKNLLHSRHLLFVLSLGAGMIADRGALWTMPLVLPALALVMTLSTLGISNDVFRAPRALLPQALLGTVMNYVVLGNFIIALSAVLIREETLWTGFVIMAAVPPAIAVAPFANITARLHCCQLAQSAATETGLSGRILPPASRIEIRANPLKKHPYLIERHVQTATLSDECQSVGVHLSVDPVVTL